MLTPDCLCGPFQMLGWDSNLIGRATELGTWKSWNQGIAALEYSLPKKQHQRYQKQHIKHILKLQVSNTILNMRNNLCHCWIWAAHVQSTQISFGPICNPSRSWGASIKWAPRSYWCSLRLWAAWEPKISKRSRWFHSCMLHICAMIKRWYLGVVIPWWKSLRSRLIDIPQYGYQKTIIFRSDEVYSIYSIYKHLPGSHVTWLISDTQ